MSSKSSSSSKSAAKKTAPKAPVKSAPAASVGTQAATSAPAAQTAHLSGVIHPAQVEQLRASGIPVRQTEGGEYEISPEQREGERRQAERRRQHDAMVAAGKPGLPEFQPQAMTTPAAPGTPSMTFTPASLPGAPAAAAAQPLFNRRSTDRTLPVVAGNTGNVGGNLTPQTNQGADGRGDTSTHPIDPATGHHLTNAGTPDKREGPRNFQVSAGTMPGGQPPQLQAPAAAPAISEEMQKEMAAIAAKYGMDPKAVMGQFASASANQPRSGRENRNGISRPGNDTRTGTVWRIADEITMAKQGQPAAIGELKAHPELRNFNDHTIRTQYARWRQFNGVSGRQQPAGGQQQAAQPQATQMTAGQAVAELASGNPVSDEAFNMLIGFRRDNILNESHYPALDREVARRNPAAQQQSGQ